MEQIQKVFIGKQHKNSSSFPSAFNMHCISSASGGHWSFHGQNQSLNSYKHRLDTASTVSENNTRLASPLPNWAVPFALFK